MLHSIQATALPGDSDLIGAATLELR